jgi:hypothetical protein
MAGCIRGSTSTDAWCEISEIRARRMVVSRFTGVDRGIARRESGEVRVDTRSSMLGAGRRVVGVLIVMPFACRVVSKAVISGVVGGRCGRMKVIVGWRYWTRVWRAAVRRLSARLEREVEEVANVVVVAGSSEDGASSSSEKSAASSQPAFASSKSRRRGVRSETLILLALAGGEKESVDMSTYHCSPFWATISTVTLAFFFFPRAFWTPGSA